MRIRFGPFTLDVDSRQLTRDDRDVRLTPKAFDLLAALAAVRPKVLSKRLLQERLWPDTFVAEANLSNLIAEVREALGDRTRDHVFVRTAYGVGYAFCADATVVSESSPPPDLPLCWLEWGSRRFPLSAGAHVIGRDADVEVRVDASTVSRRHARLVVTVGGTALEDLGSKNGTFHGDARVISPVQLADRDAIGIGSLLMTFHVQGPFGTTDTHAGAAG
ncbi:MAG TPA: FHA domain-containing protein [Vicinamibacterales bacterium]|nr:FHA domain-containing protein [Vicinamibacterales bacterium]HXT69014.1 FHA domain-containing protein [Vicinamibacterales bacterium]